MATIQKKSIPFFLFFHFSFHQEEKHFFFIIRHCTFQQCYGSRKCLIVSLPNIIDGCTEKE